MSTSIDVSPNGQRITTTPEKLDNGVTANRHVYTYGAHSMAFTTYDAPGIPDTLDYVTSTDSAVTLRARRIIKWGDPAAYVLEAVTSGCPQDLDTLIADAKEAREAMKMFVEAAAYQDLDLTA